MIATDIHGCKDTFVYHNMYTIKDVKVDFAINNIVGCDSMLVEFLDLTVPNSNIKWDFGDGNTSIFNNPQHERTKVFLDQILE